MALNLEDPDFIGLPAADPNGSTWSDGHIIAVVREVSIVGEFTTIIIPRSENSYVLSTGNEYVP